MIPEDADKEIEEVEKVEAQGSYNLFILKFGKIKNNLFN